MRIDVLVDVKTTIGEGPVWDVQEQRLYWIDVVGCRVFRCTADGREVRAWDTPEPIGSMALRRGGGAVLSLANGFHFLDFNTGDTQLIVNPEPDKPHTRLNDGKVDARGRFIVGSMDTREGGADGALFRLDPDLSLHHLGAGFAISNGPCWSPDGSTFYFSDTFSGEIWAYEGGHPAWDCDRRIDGRRRGISLECPGLQREAVPLRARRQPGSRHRDAGQEGDERQLWGA